MSESDGERAARSLALEQAYVHEVYEQCADRTVQGGHWPRICQFLEELEPGALVCDVGCGNGKYLNVNHNIFKIGVDRCKSFTNITREKDNEVLTCDNLALPFRDESFDAVLSIAVVHHFSTTERRVRALKELARVLRIGGRLVISVWAMEQKHRKFESQDVLVPWPKAYCVNSSGSPMRPRGVSYDDRHRRKSAQTYLLSNRNGQRRGSKGKSYWIDPIFSPSPSTSSLSSPNETCYSFFRRALQKLAGGRRNSRAWFLENWQNTAGKERQSCESTEDDGYVDDLPIELRRLEESAPCPASFDSEQQWRGRGPRGQLQPQLSDSLSVKSKSLSSIVEVQRLDLVRSRSSIPGSLGAGGATAALAPHLESERRQQRAQATVEGGAGSAVAAAAASPPPTTKPRLVKQKTCFLDDTRLDDTCLDRPDEKSTAIQQFLKDIPEVQVPPSKSAPAAAAAAKRCNVHKQTSLNEELMSHERLEERETVRRNIPKQTSLNEELIYNGKPTFEAFKDSLYSGSATRRFQLLKNGLTNRIRQSTNNIEMVSGMAIKNGFVRILQSWTSTKSPATGTTPTSTTTTTTVVAEPGQAQTTNTGGAASPASKRDDHEPVERRLSREDGSDSSKDSSLQSDTSVDSEDSFASVIYVPKKTSSPLVEATFGPGPGSPPQPASASAPSSPRVKSAPEQPAGHRAKLASVSPLLKQFPATTSKSLPPPSPPGLSSPRVAAGSAVARPFFAGGEPASEPQQQQQPSLLDRIAEARQSFDAQPMPGLPATAAPRSQPEVRAARRSLARESDADEHQSKRSPESPRRSTIGYQTIPNVEIEEADISTEEFAPLITDSIDEALEQLSEKSLSSSDSTGTSAARTTTTEDEDSSRGNRLNQIKELLRQKPDFAIRTKPAFPMVRRASTASTASDRQEKKTKTLPRLLSYELFNPETDDLDSDSSGVSSPESVGSVISVISDERYIAKMEAAKSEGRRASGDVVDGGAAASSRVAELSRVSSNDDAEGAVGTAAQRKTDSESLTDQSTRQRPPALDKRISPVESTWNEECKRQLNDLTDRLGGNLINDIDEFCRRRKLELEQDESNDFSSVRYPSIGRHDRHITLGQQRQTTAQPAPRDLDYCDFDNNHQRIVEEDDVLGDPKPELLGQRSCSTDSDAGSSSLASNSGGDFPTERDRLQSTKTTTVLGGVGHQRRFNDSIESSDIGDSIENTISESCSQSSHNYSPGLGRRLCSSSTASLGSSSGVGAAGFGPAAAARVRLSAQTRSASEDITSTRNVARPHQRQHPQPLTHPLQHQPHRQLPRRSATSTSNGTLSGSSSQESLPSDQITYHQYYHVFREGELDQLIDKYVENLHVISSYYDHASWCIVAEKVRVWTI